MGNYPYNVQLQLKVESLKKEKQELIEALAELRCGDNSCLFNRPKIGTNGGCRCLKQLPGKLRIVLEKIWFNYKKGE